MPQRMPLAPSAYKKQLQAEIGDSILPGFKRALSDLCLGHVDDAALYAGVKPKTLRDWLNPHTDSCIPTKRLFLLLGGAPTWAPVEKVAAVWRSMAGAGMYVISAPGLELVREESRATVAAQIAGLCPDHLELLTSALQGGNVSQFLRPQERAAKKAGPRPVVTKDQATA